MTAIRQEDLIASVADAFQYISYYHPLDYIKALGEAYEREESSAAKDAIAQILTNSRMCAEGHRPICQDTGLAVCFVERGEDVHVEGGTMAEAINEGVRAGYAEGYLRKSTCHCLTRQNVGDNTPALIHIEIVPGDGLRIAFMAKGGGSENMSALGMLKPAQGWAGIRELVVGTVSRAGSNPCPPIIVGVGIGGNFEQAAINSKKALLRPLGEPNPDPELARMEGELLNEVNKLGIGPQGYGGRITALGVMILMQPCHIASLPVAVNLQCHASRHRTINL
jgi:fumarate hydratase subunit alpha